tara:strand:+ start:619 stop:849 length:231 start_codon:yes stop_codon:yes gene_type:complete
MAKVDDTKYNYIELSNKGDQIEVTDRYDRIQYMANGEILAVQLNKDALGSQNPPKDEMGLYIKLGGRIFKAILEET